MLTKKHPYLIFFILLSSASGAQVADPDWTEAIQRTDEAFADLDSNVVPGCAVGVIHEGQYIYSKGYGMANLEHDIPISSRSVFRIGSLSKQFTAAAIALLAERGEIDLDADVHTYLSDLADYGVEVTIRQMIHHISGIPDYEGIRFGNKDFYTIQEFYDHAKNLQLQTNPEVEYSYSNTAYFFLSQVVERVTGESLREFAAREIFSRLDMQNSFFNDNVNGIVPNRADGYKSLEDGTFEIFMTNLSWVGDGGVYTSLEDFLKWDQNFYNNRLGDRGSEFIDVLETPHSFLESSRGPQYAWGMVVRAQRGHRFISHDGGWVGFQSSYFRYPELNLSFVALCNVSNADPTSRIRELTRVYLSTLGL